MKTHHFIVLHLDGIEQVQDYPAHMPIPQIGERILWGGSGYFNVTMVQHTITETATNIDIFTERT